MNTDNINKTWTPYKTNDSKYEPNIVFTQNSDRHHNMELKT